MAQISAQDLRRHARSIIARVRRGESLVLTYRGEPVARLEPLDRGASDSDPFYTLADRAVEQGDSMTNTEIDRAVYGG